ncbi:chemotaxis protein CheA [candidate division TA06 bacterium]|uniref:Chemotaxis protein CheA n=1 Tax=candidate division TA06 bacterium TaxID=2250710 RepID=A0A933MK58_UNCT6|nr:chemotaxis protein CheA [candidate division TA06 bacterium]
MKMDTNKYRDLFVSETREHLVSLNRALLALEKNPGDPALLDEIFRSLHTIKGMAGSIGQDQIAELAHKAEDLLDKLRKRQLKLAQPQVDAIFESIDYLESAVAELAAGRDPQQGLKQRGAELAKKIEALVAAPQSAKAETSSNVYGGNDFSRINPLKTADSFVYKIRVLLEADAALKSARAFLILHTLEQFGKIAYTVPERRDLEAERFDRGFSVLFVTNLHSEKEIKSRIASGEIEDIEIEEVVEETEEQAVERRTVSAFTQLAQERPREVKVSTARLDKLMNLVGELVVWRERLKQLAQMSQNAPIQDSVDQVALITSELQHQVLASRLVAMSEIFDRFPRVVRDAAKVLSKDIDFKLEGRELEMDRSILQMLAEPLVHLLRNAVDHGMETIAQRKALGKRKIGSVTLSVQKVKDQALIVVEDDGRGIDPEKIKKKALEKGWVTPEQASKLSQKQVFDFLARPGFSTAEKVTEVSGRGVGLDVVKSRIEGMGGSFSIESTAGKGSRFLLNVPLSLAIIRTLLVSSKDQVYALPMSQVMETFELKPENVKTLQGKTAIVYRSQAIPVQKLSRALKLESEAGTLAGPTVVLERQDSYAAYIIDRIVGQQEIVVKPLSRFLKYNKTFSGAAISREGQPMLIVDVNNLET